jgi:hypothetical protein
MATQVPVVLVAIAGHRGDASSSRNGTPGHPKLGTCANAADPSANAVQKSAAADRRVRRVGRTPASVVTTHLLTSERYHGGAGAHKEKGYSGCRVEQRPRRTKIRPVGAFRLEVDYRPDRCLRRRAVAALELEPHEPLAGAKLPRSVPCVTKARCKRVTALFAGEGLA